MARTDDGVVGLLARAVPRRSYAYANRFSTAGVGIVGLLRRAGELIGCVVAKLLQRRRRAVGLLCPALDVADHGRYV